MGSNLAEVINICVFSSCYDLISRCHSLGVKDSIKVYDIEGTLVAVTGC
jgi:hypothetical protein